jgi:hypothetical protein
MRRLTWLKKEEMSVGGFGLDSQIDLTHQVGPEAAKPQKRP